MLLSLLLLFWAHLVLTIANSELEANVTARMKHLMESFMKDGSTHPFADVLVFVHSNYNIPLAQAQMYYKMWHGVFPRMILFAEWSHETVHELHQHGLPAYKCPHNGNGRVAQIIMLKGLEQFHHPSFSGYMYIHDDLLISPAKILTLDKTKLWIGNGMERTELEPWSSRGWRWFWWNDHTSGIDAVQSVYNEHPDMADIMAKCEDRKTGLRGSAHTLYNGHSDFFYLPKAYIPSYQKYMGILAEKQVFLETAVATWAKCFTPYFDTMAVELELCTTWDYSKRSDIMKWGPYCRDNTTIIHPVKYSDPAGLKFAQEFLQKHATKYSNITL